MKSAEEIAENYITQDNELPIPACKPLEWFIKQAQIEALEWALRSHLNIADDEKFFDKLQAKIKELKGEK